MASSDPLHPGALKEKQRRWRDGFLTALTFAYAGPCRCCAARKTKPIISPLASTRRTGEDQRCRNCGATRSEDVAGSPLLSSQQRPRSHLTASDAGRLPVSTHSRSASQAPPLGPRGFALASMRSAERSRYYIQVPLSDRLEDWPERRLWDELEERFAGLSERPVARGPALEVSIAPLRSYVCETMRYGRLFLAGDAAHIVPPTGAKGLNLAASDVAYLSDGLIRWYRDADSTGLDSYAERALRRVWKSERFSWQLTNLMHRFPKSSPFERAMQEAELDYLAGSQAMQAVVAENYVGLPL